jgi:hypothetical protein
MSDQPTPRRSFLKGALTTPLAIAGSSLLAPPPAQAHRRHGDRDEDTTAIGPSTTTAPYLAPSIVGAKTVSVLSVGDSIGGYRMVGLPDGLGAFASGRNEFTVLMNHELSATDGVLRGHGAKGAFVSRWTIDSRTLAVSKGEDFTPSPSKAYLWDVATGKYRPAAAGEALWQRHCSGDLAAPGSYFSRGLGTADRIYLNGEEVTDGRGWARIATGPYTGEAWQLPRFGRLAYENAVASPHPQRKTIVALTDDSDAGTAPLPTNNGSEVYFYIGMKQPNGHPIDRAGLTNGAVYGVAIKVNGAPVGGEDNAYGLGNATTGYVGTGRFDLVSLGDASSVTSGRDFEQLSNNFGVTRLQRCEDGAWDPRDDNAGDFYFVTTASSTSNCRLWRLRFDDIEQPELGGTVEILLRGDEGHRMLDNVTIDKLGRILMDEDPGNDNRIAKIWLYSIETRQLIQVAAHNPREFDRLSYPSAAATVPFQTADEEASGIIDAADILGDGWFLLDVQAHVNLRGIDPELVEGGQLLALWVHPDVGMSDSDKGSRHDDNHGRR